MPESVILGASRTPIGSFLGTLGSLPAPALGSIAITESIRKAGIAPADVEEVIMGNVLTAGEGQAPARQAALGAKLERSVGCLTVNKVCGSGLMAVALADRAVRLGEADVVVAGGMESMSNAPYLLPKARTGMRMGHAEVVDSMVKDGLWDVYNEKHMGSCAELCAQKYAFSRQAQDEFAIRSFERAQAAQKSGAFQSEMAVVTVPQKKGDPIRIDADEGPGKAQFDKLKKLPPAFEKEGTITAGNASSLNDGGAAIVVASSDRAKREGWKPMARILGAAWASREPEWFTIAPVDAVKKVLQKTGLRIQDIDLFEVNEAFAVVTMAAIQELGLDPEKVNVRGGAVALGHPIGASGARILATLLHALQERGAKRGLATLCIGGGEGIALVVERL